MDEPIFLTLEDVLRIHEDQIERYGGESGIRDLGLVDSAVAVPKATFDGSLLHSNMVEIVAAYLFHLATNHPFVDGNKRTAAATALVFLEINDIATNIPNDELYAFVMKLADGAATKAETVNFFRQWVSLA